MSDLFPAVGAFYPPTSFSLSDLPFSTMGILDEGGTRFNDCRVIVHKNRIIVGSDGPRGPRAIFSAEVQEVFKDSRFTRVLTVDGTLVVFASSKGCGCGSRLRSWNPYGTIVSA